MRNNTWTNIGTEIGKASNVMEALKLSGLDYQVEKKHIYLPNGVEIPGQYATVKVGTDETFGIVGEQYEIVQNEDAFSFVDSIIPEGLEFVKAGESKDFIYIISKLPERYILGDKFTPYVIFQNSHNGYSTLRAAIAPLRIVCQNQFAKAFKNADNKISIRHSISAHDKLEDAKSVLQETALYMDTFEKEANNLVIVKLNKKQQNKIIDEMFRLPENASTRRINTMEENRNFYITALQAEDNQNFQGTAWGMVNAFADYATHLQPKRNTETAEFNRFKSMTLDNNTQLNQFIDLVMRHAA